MAHWRERGIEFQGLRMEDGSGLARGDYIRPRDLAKLLWMARRGPHGDVFFESLSAAYGGRLRWKGGTMSRVRAYAGYTTGRYAFVLMINNFDDVEDPHSERVQKIVEILLTLPPPGKRRAMSSPR